MRKAGKRELRGTLSAIPRDGHAVYIEHPSGIRSDPAPEATMQVDQLRHDEKLLLIGLYHRLIHADGVVSPEERRALSDLRRRMRVEDWGELLGEAHEAFPDVAALSRACRLLEDPAACQLIYEELVRLAASEEVAPSEGDLLSWLAVTWGFVTLEGGGLSRSDDRIGDDDATVEVRVLRPEEIFQIDDDDRTVEMRIRPEDIFGGDDLTVEMESLRAEDLFDDDDQTVEMHIDRE